MKNRKWKLEDLVDFEVLLDRVSGWKKSWRGGVKDGLNEKKSLTEKERRRLGFRGMLEDVRGGDLLGGGGVVAGAKMLEMGLFLLMCVLGLGVARGLLTDFSYKDVLGQEVEARGFNVWIFLMLALGVQWVVIFLGGLAYVFWRKWSGDRSVLQSVVSLLIKKWGGKRLDGNTWMRIVTGEGKRVWSWRLTRILQAGGIGYNLGLLAGIFGCLWFLNVGYYWETSLPQFGEESLVKVTRVLSFPAKGELPGERAIAVSKLGAVVSEKRVATESSGLPLKTPREYAYWLWSLFFFLSLILWGLFPRVLFWIIAWVGECRALAGLAFQESRHRNLWRDVTRVQRGEISSSQADGVVLLDIGGLEIETEEIRPFLLQELRVNPESRFSLGTLNEAGEREALDAARAAEMGVVFLVEGWNLSPKQMSVYHAQVRESIGEGHMIRYLVMGKGEELKQWATFVDGLKDSESEVYGYDSV